MGTNDRPVAVVGAGQAGVATAVALRDREIPVVLIDGADSVGASWRGRYDSLRLNTWRRLAELPGRRPYPPGTPMFPTRDQVVAYLGRHAATPGIELRLGTAVHRVDRVMGGWRLDTDGGPVDAAQVVIATGLEHTPVLPEWPGRQDFSGSVCHSADYRNPQPYAGKRVLVVGAGTSAFEIAHDLATGGAETVWMSVRTPPSIAFRKGPGPLPGDFIAIALYHLPTPLADAIVTAARPGLVGDLSGVGLSVPPEGPHRRGKRLLRAPAILDPEVLDSVRDGTVRVVADIAELEPDGARLIDGTRLEPDAIVCATGFRSALEPLVGHLGVLDDRSLPRIESPRPAAAGLWLSGYGIRPAYLGYLSKQARRTAKRIADHRAELEQG